MLKMLLDANGGIVLTNDGNAILREIDVSHPAAKSIIELSRTQDEEVGDGTTSVIILGTSLEYTNSGVGTLLSILLKLGCYSLRSP
jgi:T-complex protein 1 subunit gamma